MSYIDISSKGAEALSSSVLQNERLESRDLDQDPGILPVPESTTFGFSMVGNGESRSWCGELRFRGCFNQEEHLDSTLEGENPFHKDVIQKFYASCGRLDCPICYEKACGKLAKKISWRIKHFHLKGRKLEVIHVTASAPNFAYSWSFEKLKAQAIKLLKVSGFIGGSLIFHPWRLKCSRCGGSLERDTAAHKICVDCGSSFSVWVFSPHFHALGYGWIKRTDFIYDNHGWVIRNLGVRKSVSGTALYQLSHAGFSKKKHSVVWFGALAYNKMRCPKLPKEEHLCPVCKEKMVAAKLKDPYMKTSFSKYKDGEVFFVDPGVFEEDLYHSVDPGGGSLEVIEKRLLNFLKTGGNL